MAARSNPYSTINQVRDVFPKLGELTDKVVFGDVWERKGLSKRDRSLVTLSSLVTQCRLDQLQGHLRADQPADIAALQAGIRLLGAGRALRRQETAGAAPNVAFGNSRISDDYVADLLKRGHAQFSDEPEVHRDAA